MNNEVTEQFFQAIIKYQIDYGFNLIDSEVENLTRFYDLVQKNNPLLHLVGPSSAEEFAVRHILESLTLLEYLPLNARFADVGTGAGLPSIPCLIVRPDLQGVLIESKTKKTRFLQEAAAKLKLGNRVQIINRQFEEIPKPAVSFVLCRALDKFTQKLPKLLKWSDNAHLLFFGGPALREELQKNKLRFEEKLMPMSVQRFLFVVKKRRYL